MGETQNPNSIARLPPRVCHVLVDTESVFAQADSSSLLSFIATICYKNTIRGMRTKVTIARNLDLPEHNHITEDSFPDLRVEIAVYHGNQQRYLKQSGVQAVNNVLWNLATKTCAAEVTLLTACPYLSGTLPLILSNRSCLTRLVGCPLKDVVTHAHLAQYAEDHPDRILSLEAYVDSVYSQSNGGAVVEVASPMQPVGQLPSIQPNVTSPRNCQATAGSPAGALRLNMGWFHGSAFPINESFHNDLYSPYALRCA